MRWKIRTNNEEFTQKCKQYEDDFESKFPTDNLPPLPDDFFDKEPEQEKLSGLVIVDRSDLYTKLYQQGGWEAIGKYEGVDINGPDCEVSYP